jgi:L-alanine-DL-glutamate epimerase-like enolase superfamily enzyme
MKIAEIETHPFHPPLQEWNRDAIRLFHGQTWDTRTLIILRSDTGLEGYGEVLREPTGAIQTELDRLRGTNPCRWLASNINIGIAPAIYDLVAKAKDVPVYHLFGPKVRSYVPVSAWTVSQTPAKMAEEVQHAASAGHTWLKYHTNHFHNIIEQTKAMAEVAPPGFKIHYDVNFDNTVDQIVDLDRQLSEFPVAGLIEDPLRPFDFDGYKLLRQKCVLPIIFHHLQHQGREAIMGLADGYMLGHSSVDRVVRRAGLFEAANVPFMMQNIGGAITQSFIVHMASAMDRATLHHVTCENLWAEDVVSPRFRVIGGRVDVGKGPGLGVTVDRDALERLKTASPPPIPKALNRIRCGHGLCVYARPPLNRNPLLRAEEVPGVGEGYDRPVDQDNWFNDGSAEFAKLWEQTEVGPVSVSP